MENKNELKITLVLGSDMTLRDLDTLRSDLFNYLQNELSTETATITQPLASRTLDPAVVGTISLVILPIVLEKLGDLLIKWVELRAELRKDCLVKITVPIKGGRSVEITYDPKTTSKDELNNQINAIVSATKSNQRRHQK
jgi:hypothetical protein